jgi:hypothetical protein
MLTDYIKKLDPAFKNVNNQQVDYMAGELTNGAIGHKPGLTDAFDPNVYAARAAAQSFAGAK